MNPCHRPISGFYGKSANQSLVATMDYRDARSICESSERSLTGMGGALVRASAADAEFDPNDQSEKICPNIKRAGKSGFEKHNARSFAPCTNIRFEPIPWKNNVFLAQKMWF